MSPACHQVLGLLVLLGLGLEYLILAHLALGPRGRLALLTRLVRLRVRLRVRVRVRLRVRLRVRVRTSSCPLGGTTTRCAGGTRTGGSGSGSGSG